MNAAGRKLRTDFCSTQVLTVPVYHTSKLADCRAYYPKNNSKLRRVLEQVWVYCCSQEIRCHLQNDLRRKEEKKTTSVSDHKM